MGVVSYSYVEHVHFAQKLPILPPFRQKHAHFAPFRQKVPISYFISTLSPPRRFPTGRFPLVVDWSSHPIHVTLLMRDNRGPVYPSRFASIFNPSNFAPHTLVVSPQYHFLPSRFAPNIFHMGKYVYIDAIVLIVSILSN